MIRILVVDDSSLVRRLVVTALSVDPELEVVGTACDGLEAIKMVDELKPDVVTLDIEMPNLDGLGALKEIRERDARLPVIMFSTLTERGATATLEALALGASDYVTKPSNTGSVAEGLASVREQIIPKIRALAGVRRMVGSAQVVARKEPTPATVRPEVLLIGCSTGGPDALSQVLAALPETLPVPVLIVQHMPPVFTTMFAERLNRVSPLTVKEVEEGDELRPGHALLARGDHHMRLVRSAGVVRATLDQGPQLCFVRPAVDALFQSAAEIYQGRALGVILTGMGQDGLEGCRAIARFGARIIVQDEATSVVWGMPAAVATAGLADETLPLSEIAGAITQALTSK